MTGLENILSCLIIILFIILAFIGIRLILDNIFTVYLIKKMKKREEEEEEYE